MKNVSHNERCKSCKEHVKQLLLSIFGDVRENFDLNLPCHLADYKNLDIYSDVEKIYLALVNYRNFDAFVKSKRLPRVDFFIPNKNVIVEFDESQHFTKPRDISLSLYPQEMDIDFSVKYWRSLCKNLNKRDNVPIYRDEQRAWYDTLRDFAPKALGAGKTIRLYSRDKVWCSLNPDSNEDLEIFANIISCSKGE